MRCPTCKTEFEGKIKGVWPFCSKRCKMVDLGRWSQEDYRIPGPEVDLESTPLSAEDLDEISSDGS